MKKIITSTLLIFVVLTAIFGETISFQKRNDNNYRGISIFANAAKIIATGNCGEIDEEKGLNGKQVKWTLDSDGLLIISGVGSIKQYSLIDSPWYSDSNIKIIMIQNGVESIGSNSFGYCYSLESVYIPDSVTNIGDHAFVGCLNLISVEMGNGVKTIGEAAFEGCAKLKSATIPDSVSIIGSGAFGYCEGLTSVAIPEGVTTIENSVFSCCSSLVSVSIPDSVTSIENSAFSACWNLSSVIIPVSVNEIEERAFGTSSVLLYVYSGSYAQEWAKNNKMRYRMVSDLIGDPDSDGKYTSADARLALRASVQLEKYVKGSAQFFAVDVNKDGKITPDDARFILRVSVNLESFDL